MIWSEVKGADQNYGYGEVVNVWFHEDVQYFDFFCQINGGLRTSSILKVIEKPSARMNSKLISNLREIRELNKKK